MISRLAICDELDAGHGDGADQENMNEASLMQEKLENEPNQEK